MSRPLFVIQDFIPPPRCSCGPLACYSLWVGSWLPMFRKNVSVPYSGVKQSKANKSSRNVGNQLRTYAMQQLSFDVFSVGPSDLAGMILSKRLPHNIQRSWA